MIEAVAHFTLEDAVEKPEVDHEAGFFIDGAGHGHVAHVGVTVEVRMRARAEHLRIFLIVPIGATVAMRRGERHAAGQ